MTGRTQTTDQPLFRAVVCGIDGTRACFEAARQAARLVDERGRLVLVAATHFLDAVSGRRGPERLPWDPVGTGERDVAALTEAVRAMAGRSLEWAERQVGDSVAVERRVVAGRAFEELPREAERAGANLIAIGAHGGRRLVGAALGSVGSMLLHDAPTSVVVARAPFDPGAYPSRIAVGVDGSQAAAAALALARRLRRDAATDLTVVAATATTWSTSRRSGAGPGPGTSRWTGTARSMPCSTPRCAPTSWSWAPAASGASGPSAA
jgi:nucleotide-binding universal stress UspA family protein